MILTMNNRALGRGNLSRQRNGFEELLLLLCSCQPGLTPPLLCLTLLGAHSKRKGPPKQMLNVPSLPHGGGQPWLPQLPTSTVRKLHS